MTRNRSAIVGVSVVVAVSLLATLWFWQRGSKPGASEELPTFVGSASCAECHEKEYAEWRESNHRHAMESPSPGSVLGDFDNSEFRYFGRTTRFFKEGESFRIATENDKGDTETYSVAYTLGYKPLQQYLVETGRGRIQVLPFAWDTRDRQDGGQRWFHLYPEEDVKPDSPLFWTRPLQNWNHMCGDCHTTGFSKNTSSDGSSFASTWAETGNGCESCHGPASEHVAARRANQTEKNSLISKPAELSQQIDQCGACHARRTRLFDVPGHGRTTDAMLESWRPQLPQEGLYFVDGQIREEVFEIGSFLQSRMSAEGVRCTDCHEPHTGQLKADGNALCAQCHDPKEFDSTEHHFHKSGSGGALCVNCHMPERTYMVIDPRRDHRLAIPRPDLSDTLGSPNPCVGCHADRSNAWAADVVLKQWARKKGSAIPLPKTWGEAAWQAAREQRTPADIVKMFDGGPGSITTTPLAKAAVLASLKTWTPEAQDILKSQGGSGNTFERFAMIQVAGRLPVDERKSLLTDLLSGRALSIRMEAASLLAGTLTGTLTKEENQNLDSGLAEYRSWLQHDADRAESMAALAGLQIAEGNIAGARLSFEKALQRDETSLTALLNFADFYRALGDDNSAEPLLTRAVTLYPEAPGAHLALGLLRVRQKRTAEAMKELAQAMQLAPDDSHTTYVYAVGLYSTGEKERAVSVLRSALRRFPLNREISSALQAYSQQ